MVGWRKVPTWNMYIPCIFYPPYKFKNIQIIDLAIQKTAFVKANCLLLEHTSLTPSHGIEPGIANPKYVPLTSTYRKILAFYVEQIMTQGWWHISSCHSNGLQIYFISRPYPLWSDWPKHFLHKQEMFTVISVSVLRCVKSQNTERTVHEAVLLQGKWFFPLDTLLCFSGKKQKEDLAPKPF